jgi:hypothetical protein
MLVLRHRLAIAGVIAAAAIAVPVAAFATGTGSPPTKSAPSTTAPAAAKSPPPGNPAPPAGAAASKDAKAGQQEVPAPVQAFAARLGVGPDAAGPALKEVAQLAGQNGGLNQASPAFIAIARHLGVSPASLAAAWDAVSGQLALS